MHASNSVSALFYMVVMNPGYQQNYYNLAQQQKNELGPFPGSFQEHDYDHIYSKQTYHSNYPTDKRGL